MQPSGEDVLWRIHKTPHQSLLPVNMRISTSGLRQQFIPVNGIINARDLGGYIIQDGRRLRDGMLIRSAHLADATDEDLQYLLSIPISKVIDFRKDIEMNGKNDRMVPGVRNDGSLPERPHRPYRPGHSHSQGTLSGEIAL